jgi:hypothetical protein
MCVGTTIPFRCNGDQRYDPTIANMLDVEVVFQYSRAWPKPSPEKKVFRFLRACKLVAHFDGYLGTELLTGAPLPVPQANITNPLVLLQAHNVNVGDGPRIFIVAGCQRLIGPAVGRAVASTAPAPDPLSRHSIVMHRGVNKVIDESIPGPLVDDTKRRGSKPMNSPSICCVMLTRRTTTAFALKHYFAGDALWDMEALIAAWLSAPPAPLTFPLPARLTTPFMKLSQ